MRIEITTPEINIKIETSDSHQIFELKELITNTIQTVLALNQPEDGNKEGN